MAADRNRLCGILALHLDFVSRDQLIAAMNAWGLEKRTGLDEVFVSQKVLDVETRDLLVALVTRHLEHHNGNAERSLASLSSIGSARDDLLSLRDTDVDATLQYVARSRHEPDAMTVPQGGGSEADHDPAKRSAVRFHIVRPKVRGGLGEVFVVRDEELNREVALKEMQELVGPVPTGRSESHRRGRPVGTGPTSLFLVDKAHRGG